MGAAVHQHQRRKLGVLHKVVDETKIASLSVVRSPGTGKTLDNASRGLGKYVLNAWKENVVFTTVK
jgi:hypothetical protein